MFLYKMGVVELKCGFWSFLGFMFSFLVCSVVGMKGRHENGGFYGLDREYRKWNI